MTSMLLLHLLVTARLLACEEPRVSDVYQPGDEATFVIEAAGQRIGEHGWRYAGPADLLGTKAHHFEGGLRLEQRLPLGVIELRASGDFWTDDAGRPLRFVARSEAGGTAGGVEWTFADGKATGRITQGPSRREVAADAGRDVYLLANNWVGMIELVGALAPPEPGTPRRLSMFSADAGQVLPFELRHQGTFTAERDGATIEGEKYRDSLGEVLKVTADGKLFELEVPQQAVKIRRSDEPFSRPAIELAPPPRADFEREEVVIEHRPPPAANAAGRGAAGGASGGAVRLAGTVTRKKGATARLPAVFFVSGSGGQDREGVAGGIDLGTHEILDRLTDEGFLVLRVDDRGVGESVGPTEGLTLGDLVDDARACVDFLLARDDVKADRVFVIGHSEGGVTAPILACERPLAGIVLLAAPGRSLLEILRDQKERALADAGVPEFLRKTELAEHAKALELLTKEGDADPSELRADYRPEWKNRDWYRSHRRHDVIAQIRKVKCPVLIAQGADDLQVAAERDTAELTRALAESKHPDATTKVFPKLDHLFKKVEGEKPSFQDYFKPRPVDREFLDTLVAWLRSHAP